MITASYEFEHGYVRPIFRGVLFWNGSEELGTATRDKDFTDLICEAIGSSDAGMHGCNLKGIKIIVEIEEAIMQ